MYHLPEKINDLNSPYVAAAFITYDPEEGNTLILEMPRFDKDDVMYDTYLTELLLELENLKRKAEKKVGVLTHVNIRTVH